MIDFVALLLGLAVGAAGGFGWGWLVGRDLVATPQGPARVVPFGGGKPSTTVGPHGRRIPVADLEQQTRAYVDEMNEHAARVTS